jgi:prophage regulatory protein
MPKEVEIYRMPKMQERNGGVCRATIYLWVKRGILPPPIKLGPRTSGWIASEVEESLARRVQTSREGQQ